MSVIQSDTSQPPAPAAAASPGLPDLARTFGHIGLVGFGGPAGQIALMHRLLVEERGWLDDAAFLRALNFCHLLPGPEAMQLAAYVGWRLHGTAGGLIAGLLFILPGAGVILGLSILYTYAADLGAVQGALFGIKAAVLAVAAHAVFRLGARALKTLLAGLLAAAAFIALFGFAAPFPLVVLGAGVIGFVAAAVDPSLLGQASARPPAQAQAFEGQAPGRPGADAAVLSTVRTILIWGAVWSAPVLGLWALLGPDHVLIALAVLFSKLAVGTFGGAYAVLAYIAQEAVQGYGWLTPREVVDALGLAETTPGPLILVGQFVGFLAAFRAPDPLSPLVAGVVGAAVVSWVTFAPCFLWIFALAPWIERLEHARRLQGALAGVTAAVVGVIANLTLWFALHVLFARVDTESAGPVRMHTPDLASLDLGAAAMTAAAGVLLVRLKLGVPVSLGLCAAAGVILTVSGLL